jgi:nucleotidyltransferase/DNA polymerase involved in DNA repair
MERWQQQGSCLDSGVDFFGERVTQQMIDLCSDCPVVEECLDHALRNETYGYWGNTSEFQRKKIRRVRGISHPTQATNHVAPLRNSIFQNNNIEHGTERGYQAHNKKRIPTCESCRAAHKEKIAMYRKNLKMKATL